MANKQTNLKSLWLRTIEMPEGCWNWTGALWDNGYGRVSYRDEAVRVHRLIWEFIYGPISEDMFVCHLCDNPKCCNINHLWLGTPLENQQDRVAKGKGNKPEESINAILTWEQVDWIRRMYATQLYSQTDLARAIGVGRHVIYKVVNNHTWRR